MAQTQDAGRLLAIIDAQNRIAATQLDLDAVMDLVAERAQALTGADAGVVELVEADEMVYRAVAGTARPHKGVRDARASGLSGICVATGEVVRSDDTSSDARVDRGACERAGAGSIVCVPLRHDDEVVGVLRVYSAAAGAFDDTDVETLELFGAMIAAQLAHASNYEAEYDNRRRDLLTDLGNRPAYEEQLAAECSRARRHGHSLSLCLFNLDGFKAVNDAHGHPAGDRLLRQTGKILSRLRAEDSAFRTGGDEFAVLLPGTTASQAGVPMERIAGQIASRLDGGVTASFGLADRPIEPHGLHEAAAARLLEAKATRTEREPVARL